jgi:hypothetical protein
MYLRVGAILLVTVVVACGSDGGDDTKSVGKEQIAEFCAAGVTLVEEVIDDPSSRSARRAYEELDRRVADEMDVRLRRLNPERNQDAGEMVERLLDGGCDEDDFEESLDVLETTVPIDTFPDDTFPDDTFPDDTFPDDTEVTETTIDLPEPDPLPPDQSVIVVPVPSPALAQADIDRMNALTPLTDYDVASVTAKYAMLDTGFPLFVPAGGHLIGVNAGISYGFPTDALSFALTDDGSAQGTIDALVAAVETYDQFTSDESTDSYGGYTATIVRLNQSDYVGPDYSIEVATTDSQPGVVFVTIERDIFSSDSEVRAAPPEVVEAAAPLQTAAAAYGVGELTGWSVEYKYDPAFDDGLRSYTMQWNAPDATVATAGPGLCADLGLTVDSNEDTYVSCSDSASTTFVSVSESYESGSDIVVYLYPES